MKNLFTFLIIVLATFRLTELVTKDEGPYSVFQRFRLFLGKRAMINKHWQTMADAVHCHFCFGVYASVIIILCPQKLRYILAVAGGQSLLESLIKSERE